MSPTPRSSTTFQWILSLFLVMIFPSIGVHGSGNSMIELKEVLIIAGNFSFDNELTNLAQYDISTGT
jgi:hypothetical protein